ncbi:peroxiredoxin [soil metagenome]
MALKVGDKAPDFSLKSKNQTGEVKDVKLSDFKGKNVVLSFFPQSFTGTCTTQMCTISNDAPEYGDNTETLGISVDSVFTQEAFGKQNNINYPLLSDFNREVTDTYGVRFGDDEFVYGMKGVAKRAVFVIDKDGVIRYTETTENAGKLPDFEKVKEALKDLK